MVERARLESVYTVLSRIEGSNPSLSANISRKTLKTLIFLRLAFFITSPVTSVKNTIFSVFFWLRLGRF